MSYFIEASSEIYTIHVHSNTQARFIKVIAKYIVLNKYSRGRGFNSKEL